MNPSSILHAFGFELSPKSPLESIYAYAPVFRMTSPAGEWIVKRTQKPASRARAVATWTRSLSSRGIPVVTPAGEFGDNPRGFPSEDGEDEFWVVYPYIRGRAYSGNLSDIQAAGELLGRIHLHEEQVDFGLKISKTVIAIDEQEVSGDIRSILGFVERFFPESIIEAKEILAERTQRYYQNVLPALLPLRLPMANCTWDYKASNLIYKDDPLPVLVDPDNAGRIPRAYDLAIAALLFHNDGLGPGRLFNRDEWLAFLDGYLRTVSFNKVERVHWDDLLLCAWVDEALWLLNGSEEDWADPQQASMLHSLLLTDLSLFTLP